MIPSGALHHIHEILDNPQLHSASVRVLGELIVFDARRQRAVITHNGRNLAVDTSLLGPIAFAVGSTYQFIGEVQVETNHTEPASSHGSIGGAGGGPPKNVDQAGEATSKPYAAKKKDDDIKPEVVKRRVAWPTVKEDPLLAPQSSRIFVILLMGD